MLDFSGLLKSVAQKFSVIGVRYALIGGFALHAAGYTRATGDVDFLVHQEDAEAVKEVFRALGYHVSHEDESVLNLSAPWQVAGGVDVIWASRRYTLDMLAKAVVVDLANDVRIPVIGPEGIIGLKVQAIANDPQRRSRDMVDIEWLVLAHAKTMNMVLVREYFDLFNMGYDLDQIVEKGKNA